MNNIKDKKWHALDSDEVCSLLKSDMKSGLSEAEVAERERIFGKNSITQKKEKSALVVFLLQFHNPLIYILLVAGGVSVILGENVDASVIFGVVLINSIIGFIQESRAKAAINSLKNMLSSDALVIRGGKKQQIKASDLVPGDIVLLASGDKVGADMRLLKVTDLQIDESALTGESVSAQKNVEILKEDTVLADRVNSAYAGTLVTYGQGIGVVSAIGDSTETGKIAHLIHEATEIETPLTKKINAFSKLLLVVILALSAVTFVVGVLRGQDAVDVFMAAVALAVAAIPEGLPAVVTITLAIGVGKMASRHAVIRKLPAVETLGSTTVICSDKTGTLTENQMTVEKIYVGGETYELSGAGYEPKGEITLERKSTDIKEHTTIYKILKAGVLCNDSSVVFKEGRYIIEGDPTEGALIVSAQKGKLNPEELVENFTRIDSIPFESDRQYMATLHKYEEKQEIYVKGSLERVLEMCKGVDVASIEEEAKRLASEGLRVLAFACKEGGNEADPLEPMRINKEKELTFLGLQAMIDPPREEAIKAVELCKQAGIKIKMITGDHSITASAIAEKLGMNVGKQAYNGAALAKMSKEELLEAAHSSNVFARVAPEQKLSLVKALQAKGEICAMTGDGVNDAPALKQADIGIAMGKAGTEVAKEAADMVLTDDNFASIAAAVEEGRGVYDNLIKFITWILPTNLGQGLVIMLAILLGATLPVLPVQALWLNMTTAVFLGLMLAFEPKERGIMTRSPRKPDTPILSGEITARIFLISFFLLAGAFGLFQLALHQGRSLEEARTLAVTLFVVVQTFYLFNCRTLKVSLFSVNPLSNPWIPLGVLLMALAQLAFIYLPQMNMLFSSAPISLFDIFIITIYGFVSMLLVELEKYVRQKYAAS